MQIFSLSSSGLAALTQAGLLVGVTFMTISWHLQPLGVTGLAPYMAMATCLVDPEHR